MKKGYPFDGKPYFYHEAIGTAKSNIRAAREGWYTHGIACQAALAFIRSFPNPSTPREYRDLRVMENIYEESAKMTMRRRGFMLDGRLYVPPFIPNFG